MSTEPNSTILLGDDESEVRSFLEVSLQCHGYQVESATGGIEVVNRMRRGGPFAAVLLDIMMPDQNGFETLQAIREMNADIPVLMLSGMSEPNNVVRAMKIGATDFLAKPISHSDLVGAVQRAIESAAPQIELAAGPLGAMFIGSSPLMVEVANLMPKIGPSDVPILIQGETGTGKEVIARGLHAVSHGASRPFVKLNCAAVPAELAESELFGHERGAFTGAFQRKLGLFELAEGGTIFLDEIGDMDLRLQAKLLQVLQDREFRRVGGKQTVRVNVRVIAATHHNLLEAVEQKRFREDLYYRLDGFTLFLPSLRDRRQDIVPFAEFLIQRHTRDSQTAPRITSALRTAFEDYDWPGNVRQLENIIRKFMVLRNPDLIVAEIQSGKRMRRVPSHFATSSQGPQTPEVAPPSLSLASPAASPAHALEHAAKARDQAEADAILAALKSTRWNRKQAAALLNIDYKALLYKIKKLEIDEQPAA